LFLLDNGKELYQNLSSGKSISLEEVIKWQFTEKNGKNAIEFL
jgi:hypothetical protein